MAAKAAWRTAVAPLYASYEQIAKANAAKRREEEAIMAIVDLRINRAVALLMEGGRTAAPGRMEDITNVMFDNDDPWDQLCGLLDMMRRLGYSTEKVAAVRDLV